MVKESSRGKKYFPYKLKKTFKGDARANYTFVNSCLYAIFAVVHGCPVTGPTRFGPAEFDRILKY